MILKNYETSLFFQALQIERNKMETELFQVREDLNRLMVRNASTFSSAERRDPPRAPTTFSTAANSLQQELQEITVRRGHRGILMYHTFCYPLLSITWCNFCYTAKNNTSWNKPVDILQKTCYIKNRMTCASLLTSSVASCQKACCNVTNLQMTSCKNLSLAT